MWQAVIITEKKGREKPFPRIGGCVEDKEMRGWKGTGEERSDQYWREKVAWLRFLASVVNETQWLEVLFYCVP